MKATSLLEKQHRTVESLFKQLESGRSDPALVLAELANELAAHMAIEQETFYPAVQQIKEDVILESFEEHAIAELALKRLLSTSPEDQSFKARVTTLKELIQHHVEEEEKELFPAVEKAVDEKRLTELGRSMKAEFEQRLAEGYETLLPAGYRKTSADQASHAIHGSHANGAARA
ncbi:hemerythrin domain-containing protein [Sorangium sp. So ce726]|uniref:hemerythrin domain-containing protein n=1 Tax=Sorangium sp. So ce726 TaxID=3133319 RepID=UPI003F5F84FA